MNNNFRITFFFESFAWIFFRGWKNFKNFSEKCENSAKSAKINPREIS